MSAVVFDYMEYFARLKDAGIEEAQARVLAEAMHKQAEAQRAALQEAIERGNKSELALMEIKEEVKASEFRLKAELQSFEIRILKWLFRIAILGFGSVMAIMAKGFGWIGF